MNEYELMLLVDAENDEQARNAIVERAKEAVAKGGGTWHETRDWGRRKLAYPINHKTDAHYTLMLFDADGDTLDEAVRLLRITDGVLRVLGVNRVQHVPELDSIQREAEESPSGGRGRGRGRGRD